MELTYSTTPEGYRIPNLILPDEPEYHLGNFGLMRRRYLKNHRKGIFSAMLMSGKLNPHLAEIDQTANDQFELITQQMMEAESVTEDLKAQNQMEWVGKMNNIRHRAEEIIRADLIYN